MQDQVLLGRRELQGGLLIDVLGGLELEPAIGTKQRLSQRCLIGIGATVGNGRRLIDIGAHVGQLGATGNIRQQPGASLGHDFFLRAVLGAGGGQVGVVVHRFLVDADQIGLGR
ncbi:hypothetical protein D3C84_1025240 [compost metagenome]